MTDADRYVTVGVGLAVVGSAFSVVAVAMTIATIARGARLVRKLTVPPRS